MYMADRIKEHGISVAIKRNKKRVFIEIVMFGKLTHEDYTIFVPIVDKALKEAKGIEADLLIDMKKFTGWEFLAAWDDLKFGLKHRNDFTKMAIIGDKMREEVSVQMLDHLVQGKIKHFKKREKALSWILQG